MKKPASLRSDRGCRFVGITCRFERNTQLQVKLSDICNINYGKSQKDLTPGNHKIYGTGGVVGTTGMYLYNKPSIIIGRKGTINSPIYVDEPFYPIDTVFYVSFIKEVFPKWFYYQLKMVDLMRYNEASGVPSLNRDTLYKIKLYSTSINEQKKDSALLSLIDKKIEILTTKLDKLKYQKQGLMQKLLTGKIRVTI